MSTVISTSESQAIVKKVYRAFFSPSKYEVKPPDREIIEWGNNYRIPFEDGELAVTVWGSSCPVVVLMLGCGGVGARMSGFVDPVWLGGYRVVAYDQPAHGDSDG